jgi:hypothetical protein
VRRAFVLCTAFIAACGSRDAPPAPSASVTVRAVPDTSGARVVMHADPIWHAPPAVATCFDPATLREVQIGPGASEMEAFNGWRAGYSREEWVALTDERRKALLDEEAEKCVLVANEVMAHATTTDDRNKVEHERECCLTATARGPY